MAAQRHPHETVERFQVDLEVSLPRYRVEFQKRFPEALAPVPDHQANGWIIRSHHSFRVEGRGTAVHNTGIVLKVPPGVAAVVCQHPLEASEPPYLEMQSVHGTTHGGLMLRLTNHTPGRLIIQTGHLLGFMYFTQMSRVEMVEQRDGIGGPYTPPPPSPRQPVGPRVLPLLYAPYLDQEGTPEDNQLQVVPGETLSLNVDDYPSRDVACNYDLGSANLRRKDLSLPLKALPEEKGQQDGDERRQNRRVIRKGGVITDQNSLRLPVMWMGVRFRAEAPPAYAVKDPIPPKIEDPKKQLQPQEEEAKKRVRARAAAFALAIKRAGATRQVATTGEEEQAEARFCYLSEDDKDW